MTPLGKYLTFAVSGWQIAVGGTPSSKRKDISMFGIGLPEFIVILALALIVVGPDKLPDLARSVAKGILELKKTVNTLKESLTEDGNPLDEIKPELEEAAKAIKDDVLGATDDTWQSSEREKPYPPIVDVDDSSTIIDIKAEQTVMAEKNEKPPAIDKKEGPGIEEQQG